MRHLALLTAILITALAASADVWHGELAVGPQKLPLEFTFDEPALMLRSPMQSSEPIEGTCAWQGDDVEASVPQLGVTYKGTLTGETIEGTFSQNGFQAPLALVKGPYQPPRPQTPQPPFPYDQREVSFINPADSAVLVGTLTIPNAYHLKPGGSVPVAIMVTGSGLQNRDEEIFGHKPFAVIADYLARAGVATLRYDDRGFAASTGSNEGATTATYATDAAAGIEFLRHYDKPFGKVGVIGHSEGAEIAYMLGGQGVADFVVALASPAMRGDSLLMLQNEALLLSAGLQRSDVKQYIDALGPLFEYMIANPEATEWPDMPALPDWMAQNIKQIIAARNPWIDYMLAYSPAEDIAATKCSALALNGSMDLQVPPVNLASINALNPAVETIELDGLNHLFQHARTGMPTEYEQIEETFSPEALSIITKWIKALK